MLQYSAVAQIVRGVQHMPRGFFAVATAALLFGCSSASKSSLDAAPALNTALRPNDAGKVLPIGSPCKPEDGWQYVYPPGWPTVGPDSGVPTAVPIPPDYRETHQLEPGIGYCVTHLRTHPEGFFTSNCRSDNDCPVASRCDGSWCNLPCTADGDCRRGLHCPENSGRTQFCREGCPDPMPPQGWGCYADYGGPWVCAYPATIGPRTICRCALKPLNDAVWECTPESQCPPSRPEGTPCQASAQSSLTCSYGSDSCRCEGGKFVCSPAGSVDAGTATATSEAGVPDTAADLPSMSTQTCRCGTGGACAGSLICCPAVPNTCGRECVPGNCL